MAVIEDKPFSIHVEGDATGKTWTGDFRAKIRLSRRDIITRDRIRREMLGSANGSVEQHAMELATAYAELKVRITDAPPWFLENDYGLDMEDESPMANVYQKALLIENDEIKRKIKEAETKAADMKKEAEIK
jgi:hypothetical protein